MEINTKREMRQKITFDNPDFGKQLRESHHIQDDLTPIGKISFSYSLGSIRNVCFVFVALRPMSTAMVIAGRSVHLSTLFPGQA